MQKKYLLNILFLLTIFITIGCTTSSPKLPSQQTITHIKIDSDGLIAQSSRYTYLFTNEESQLRLSQYHKFMTAFSSNISKYSVKINQYDDRLFLATTFTVPRTALTEGRGALLKEFRLNNTIHKDYVEIVFSAFGRFELNGKPLDTDYKLVNPFIVKIWQPGEKDRGQDILAPLAIPLMIPFMMIGCAVGPC